MRLYATFTIQEMLFGIEVLLVREINQQLDMTPVQKAPPYIRGLINLRGQIVTIFDLALRLGFDPQEITGMTHNVIIKTAEEVAPIRQRESRPDLVCPADSVGLMVESIGDVLEIDEHRIEPTPANSRGIDARFLSGVVSLEKGLLVLLNIETLLDPGNG